MSFNGKTDILHLLSKLLDYYCCDLEYVVSAISARDSKKNGGVKGF